MRKFISRLDEWHQTKAGLLIFGLIELALTYVFGSLAIDSGSFWWYLLTVVFAVGGVHNFVKLIRKISD